MPVSQLNHPNCTITHNSMWEKERVNWSVLIFLKPFLEGKEEYDNNCMRECIYKKFTVVSVLPDPLQKQYYMLCYENTSHKMDPSREYWATEANNSKCAVGRYTREQRNLTYPYGDSAASPQGELVECVNK